MNENNDGDLIEEVRSAGTNLRQHQKNDDKKLLFVVIFTLVVVGSGVIGLVWGWPALLGSLPCLLGGALLILVPWALLTLVEKWRDGMEV
jgi:protein-S-isoprenylcysteine O-methyltransferase Ste14